MQSRHLRSHRKLPPLLLDAVLILGAAPGRGDRSLGRRLCDLRRLQHLLQAFDRRQRPTLGAIREDGLRDRVAKLVKVDEALLVDVELVEGVVLPAVRSAVRPVQIEPRDRPFELIAVDLLVVVEVEDIEGPRDLDEDLLLLGVAGDLSAHRLLHWADDDGWLLLDCWLLVGRLNAGGVCSISRWRGSSDC